MIITRLKLEYFIFNNRPKNPVVFILLEMTVCLKNGIILSDFNTN